MNTPLSEKDKIRAQLKIHPQIYAQGAPKFSAESVIKNPNQTSLHFYRRSCHPFLRLSQTKYLYYTIFNTDELLMNIWRGPGSICSYGRVVKGS